MDGNSDVIIDAVEAKLYTDRLENVLEDSCDLYDGMAYKFMKIEASDLVERQLPVDRSTEGLVGSSPTSTNRLEIRFIFNPKPVEIQSIRFGIGESQFPDALHKVFEFKQSSFVWQSGMPPMETMEGWHLDWIGSEPVFTSSYGANPGLSNTSMLHWGFWPGSSNNTTIHPVFGSGTLKGFSFGKNWTDLRFADRAYATVTYMGFASSNSTALKLQVANNPPMFDNWVDINDENGSVRLNITPWLNWRTARFPLDAYLGQRIRIRLNMTSAVTPDSAPGFFIRNFQVAGESFYHGHVEFNSVSYVVSSTSFSHFIINQGSANMIRTPAGEILFTSISFDSEAGTPLDSIEYRAFDFFENPQILFGLILASVYLIAFYQSRYFSQFKATHPLRYRPAAIKIKWLHWFGRIIILLLILFYFFPGMFAFAAPGFMLGGGLMWFLGVFFVVFLALFTKYLYMRQAKFIPPDLAEGAAGPTVVGVPPPDDVLAAKEERFCAECLNIIDSSANIFKCDCGKVYHRKCAAGLKECPECHRKISVVLPKEKVVTIQCPTCRELQQVKDGADLSRTKCAHCETVLKTLDEGLNYLVIDKDPGTSYLWFVGHMRRERPALCMTTSFPEKVKKEHKLEGVELYWLSDTNPGPRTLDPKRLDFEIIREISAFVKEKKGGAVLLDGLEYLIVENGFDKTFKFIKKVNDLCSVNNATFIVPIAPGALGFDEIAMLRKEFDRIEELVAPPPPPKKTGK